MLLFWWWIQNICRVDDSFLVILSSEGIVGSSYAIVSAAKWAITCVSKKGPMCGLGFCTSRYPGI